MIALPPSLRCIGIGATNTAIETGEHGAARHFARQRGLLLDGAIDAAFLAMLMEIVGRSSFVSDDIPALGHREVEQPPRAGRAIGLALKRSPFLRWLENVTQRRPLASVNGQVVQTRVAANDRLTWHDDLDRPRALAVTIGLAPTPYTGGLFELREKASGTILLQHRLTLGQMLVFDVAADIEHRVLPVESGGPRRIYTGWFMTDAAS